MYGAATACHFLVDLYTRLISSIHQLKIKVKDPRLKSFINKLFHHILKRSFIYRYVSIYILTIPLLLYF